MACQALKAVPKLALEEVDDETIIAHSPNLPLLLARDLHR